MLCVCFYKIKVPKFDLRYLIKKHFTVFPMHAITIKGTIFLISKYFAIIKDMCYGHHVVCGDMGVDVTSRPRWK